MWWCLTSSLCDSALSSFLSSFFSLQDQFQRDGKSVRQISFSNVNLVNTGEYTCHAKNGALDGNGDVIKAEKTINLFVRCKFPKALCILCWNS